MAAAAAASDASAASAGFAPATGHDLHWNAFMAARRPNGGATSQLQLPVPETAPLHLDTKTAPAAPALRLPERVHVHEQEVVTDEYSAVLRMDKKLAQHAADFDAVHMRLQTQDAPMNAKLAEANKELETAVLERDRCASEAKATERELKRMDDEMTRATAQIEKCTTQITHCEQQCQALALVLERLADEQRALTESKGEIEQQLKATQQALADATKRKADAEAELAKAAADAAATKIAEAKELQTLTAADDALLRAQQEYRILYHAYEQRKQRHEFVREQLRATELRAKVIDFEIAGIELQLNLIIPEAQAKADTKMVATLAATACGAGVLSDLAGEVATTLLCGSPEKEKSRLRDLLQRLKSERNALPIADLKSKCVAEEQAVAAAVKACWAQRAVTDKCQTERKTASAAANAAEGNTRAARDRHDAAQTRAEASLLEVETNQQICADVKSAAAEVNDQITAKTKQKAEAEKALGGHKNTLTQLQAEHNELTSKNNALQNTYASQRDNWFRSLLTVQHATAKVEQVTATIRDAKPLRDQCEETRSLVSRSRNDVRREIAIRSNSAFDSKNPHDMACHRAMMTARTAAAERSRTQHAAATAAAAAAAALSQLPAAR